MAKITYISSSSDNMGGHTGRRFHIEFENDANVLQAALRVMNGTTATVISDSMELGAIYQSVLVLHSCGFEWDHDAALEAISILIATVRPLIIGPIRTQ